jgi:PleD family two-component response regulator
MENKRKILIFDKYEFERTKVISILKFLGNFDIIEITSIEEYKVLLTQLKDVSLILFDIEFPTIKDGFSLLDNIRHHVELKDIPLIIITKNETTSNQNKALKYKVLNYLIKPYDPKRLETTMSTIFNGIKPTNYYFNQAALVTVSIEDFIEKELKLANRSSTELSILLITPFIPKLLISKQGTIFKLMKDTIYEMSIDTIRKTSRKTDTIVLNDNKDIILVLPCTNNKGAMLVDNKIREQLSKKLIDIELTFEDIFVSSVVTYPESGKSLSTLMSKALEKTTDKIRLYEINNISKEKLTYINSSYRKYN